MSALSISNIGIVLIFLTFALALLPDSPFTAFINVIGEIPYLAELNWFVPITEMLAIGQAWLVAITAYYVISLLLRWIKVIE